MRVVGYARVSTEEQAREGVSLAAQREKISAYAQAYDLELSEVISDEGFSAKTLDRPGMVRALGMLESRSIEGLLIYKLDRLTRSLGDWAGLIERLFTGKRAVRLFSVQESVNTTTSSGRMVLNMIVTIAQWEREVIGERTAEGLRHKIRIGERCGKVRYGWDLDESGPRNARGLPVRLVRNEGERDAIDLMVELRREGRSLRAIGEELKARGIPTKEGRDGWTAATINKILKRERDEASGEGEAA